MKNMATPPSPPTPPTAVTYALEQLFVDQDPDWVVDTIAAVLAWVPGQSAKTMAQPFRFDVERTRGGIVTSLQLDLSWDVNALTAHDPGLQAQVRRFATGRTAAREHLSELAAYGLSLVAISAFMPGLRVVSMLAGQAPDLLFDLTPGQLKGVETAGRRTGGRSALLTVRNGPKPKPGKASTLGKPGKAAQLLARTDIAEVHLSLWSGSPRLSFLEQLKP
jgi:hypothetical protein